MVIITVAIISFVASLSDQRKNRIPRAMQDRIKQKIKEMSQNVLLIHTTLNQNPVVSLLTLTEENSILEQFRCLLSDVELSNLTKVDIAALSDIMRSEQHKAYQRAAYFLPPQLSHDAYLQYYFPQSIYTKSYYNTNTNNNNNNNNANINQNSSPNISSNMPTNTPKSTPLNTP